MREAYITIRKAFTDPECVNERNLHHNKKSIHWSRIHEWEKLSSQRSFTELIQSVWTRETYITEKYYNQRSFTDPECMNERNLHHNQSCFFDPECMNNRNLHHNQSSFTGPLNQQLSQSDVSPCLKHTSPNIKFLVSKQNIHANISLDNVFLSIFSFFLFS